MSTPVIQSAFAAGEISPALYGQVTLAKLHSAGTTVRNFFVNYRGGAWSRQGSAYVLQSLTPVGVPPRAITFQYDLTQGICLELGENSGSSYMRFYIGGSPIVGPAVNIAGITKASPAVTYAPGHGLSNGQWVSVAGVNGMTPVNGRFFEVIVVDANNVQLYMLNQSPLNSETFPAYISGGTIAPIYQIATPWAIADLPLLKFAQSADVMSFTHPSYPQYDLARISDNDWTLTQTAFGSQVVAPENLTAVASNQPSTSTSPVTQPAAYAYVVTAVNAAGQESVASAVVNVTNSVDMSVTAGSITVTWSGQANVSYYNVYRAPTSYNTLNGSTTNALPVPIGAIFSYVGMSYGTQFVDSNTIPDTTQVPPLHQNPFANGQILGAGPMAGGSGYTTATVTIYTATGSGAVIEPIIVGGGVVGYILTNNGANYAQTDYAVVTGDGTGATVALFFGPEAGNYPGVVAYYQQRRIYASSNNNPDTFWGSKPGQFTNFDSGIPVQSGDAVVGAPWSQQVNGIQWLLQEPGAMVAMTGAGAWAVSGAGGSIFNPVALTPSSDQATPQFFAGISATVPPTQIYADILFVTAKDSLVYSMIFNYFSNNYAGTDHTVLSGHLFQGYEITQWAWCEEPYKVVWAVRCDGVLLSFTYLKEQEVFGWGRHDTNGAFISVTAVTEPPVDALYCVVQRTTPAGSFYFIERFDNRIWLDSEDPFCVDAGIANDMPDYNVGLSVSATAGQAEFVAASPVFTAGMVGSVLRISGGIALITAVVDNQHAIGTWYLSPASAVQAF